MVPLQGFALEEEDYHDGEDRQGDRFLDDLELDQAEGTAVDSGSDPVGRDHQGIFQQGDAPGKQNHQNQRPAVGDVHFRKLEMAVPGQRHEDVGANQQQYRPKSLHGVKKSAQR